MSSAVGSCAVDVQDLTVRFGSLVAIDALSVQLPAQELVAIVGPNGSGKTTLLNALSGLISSARAEGAVRIFGTDVLRSRPDRIAGLGVGRSFQDPHLIPEMSVEQNVLCGAHLPMSYGIFQQIFQPGRAEESERRWLGDARSLLESVGLDHLARWPAGMLPYGVRKLVDMVRALVPSPRLLLLDEPASGLDRREREALAGLLAGLAGEKRMTIVMVEHDLDLVRTVATHVVAMQGGGRLLASGPPDATLLGSTFRSVTVDASSGDGAAPPGSSNDQS